MNTNNSKERLHTETIITIILDDSEHIINKLK
jgi:hypothetical protein